MSELTAALARLAEAHGSGALADAFGEVRRAVLQKRRVDQKSIGALAATMTEAMRIWDEQKADGVPVVDRQAGLIKTLQAAWPKGRSEPWHDLCASCRDYGLVMHDCPGDATCGDAPAGSTHQRRKVPHLPHEYGSPCWCDKGKRFRIKPKTAEDFTGAGRHGKPTRIGR